MVDEAAKGGRIPCVRLGGPDGPLRFLPADVDSWLERARTDWLPGETAKAASRRATPSATVKTGQLTVGALAGRQR